MEIAADVFSWTFLLLGTFFCLVGGVGLLRLPDFYTRIHAGGIIDTMGAPLVVIGLMAQSDALTAVKLGFLLIFLLLTSPISSHATARSAHEKGLVPWRKHGDGAGEAGA